MPGVGPARQQCGPPAILGGDRAANSGYDPIARLPDFAKKITEIGDTVAEFVPRLGRRAVNNGLLNVRHQPLERPVEA